ncbi:TetR/AcrR family transcriptional regulator [Alteribacillus iranensis]|uniref:DNA-binding transcriptional regulator, AcrR family n=1 Tax=Alteribacillus iranensis TaxID=930128 RepID=A0A1I1ZWR9_9BACI|nr:TetR/AcrR family transcriptional regulator [Alteribacillus iranensis]SFE36082.1 DNA-binding transcriptional regulator, AcrR family [Alteribacillus iranensis]
MNNKKEQIILAALQLISERGYSSTSVQDIATYCGISKGSFYKYFSSKEDLLMEVFRYNHHQVVLHSEKIERREDLSKREKLVKLIAFEMEVLYKNRDLFLLLHKVVPSHENQKFQPIVKKTKASMIRIHKKWLLYVYGSEVQTVLWDVVLMWQGAIKELIILLGESIRILDKEEAAEKLVDRLDMAVQHMKTMEPILTSDMMEKHEKQEGEEGNEKEDELQNWFLLFKEEVRQLEFQNETEIMEALHLLKREITRGDPQKILIKSLIRFIKTETKLVHSLSWLEDVLEKNEYNY